MNAAQRVEKAIRRVEETSAALLHSAAVYGSVERGNWTNASHQRDVHENARRYANAVNGLRRVTRGAK